MNSAVHLFSWARLKPVETTLLTSAGTAAGIFETGTVPQVRGDPTIRTIALPVSDLRRTGSCGCGPAHQAGCAQMATVGERFGTNHLQNADEYLPSFLVHCADQLQTLQCRRAFPQFHFHAFCTATLGHLGFDVSWRISWHIRNRHCSSSAR